MNILHRYLAKTILSAIALIVVLLVGLEIFMLFVNQLGAIGKGHYTTGHAFLYALMQTPYQLYLFFPIACLIGTLVGLGILASHSELIVMRSNGVSITQISLATVLAALVLIIGVTAMGEWVVPQLTHMAENYKNRMTHANQVLATQRGIWARIGKHFIHITSVLPNQALQGVHDYTFDNQLRLTSSLYADRAEFRNGSWTLINVAQTDFSPTKTKSIHVERKPWALRFHTDFLSLNTLSSEEMTLPELRHAIHALEANNTSTNRYALAFWQRLFQPLTSMLMMFLAIPFIFGPLRSSTMGSRLVVGISIGFTFHIANRFFGPMVMVFQMPAILAAMLPSILALTVVIWMMRRVN